MHFNILQNILLYVREVLSILLFGHAMVSILLVAYISVAEQELFFFNTDPDSSLFPPVRDPAILPWYLYELVTQNKLRMCKGNNLKKKYATAVDLKKCFKQIKSNVSDPDSVTGKHVISPMNLKLTSKQSNQNIYKYI